MLVFVGKLQNRIFGKSLERSVGFIGNGDTKLQRLTERFPRSQFQPKPILSFQREANI